MMNSPRLYTLVPVFVGLLCSSCHCQPYTPAPTPKPPPLCSAPRGQYCAGAYSDPRICPAGKYCIGGSSENQPLDCFGTDTYCKEGEYRGDGWKCPKDYQCNGGSSQPIPCTSPVAYPRGKQCIEFADWESLYKVSLALDIDDVTEPDATVWNVKYAVLDACAVLPRKVVVWFLAGRRSTSTFRIQVTCNTREEADAFVSLLAEDNLGPRLKKWGVDNTFIVGQALITAPTVPSSNVYSCVNNTKIGVVKEGVCGGWSFPQKYCKRNDSGLEYNTGGVQVGDVELIQGNMTQIGEMCTSILGKICPGLGGSIAKNACSDGGLTCKLLKWYGEKYQGTCTSSSSCPRPVLPVCCSSGKALLRMLCAGVDEAKLDVVMSPMSDTLSCSDDQKWDPFQVTYCKKPCANTGCFSYDLESINSTTKDRQQGGNYSQPAEPSGGVTVAHPAVIVSIVGGALAAGYIVYGLVQRFVVNPSSKGSVPAHQYSDTIPSDETPNPATGDEHPTACV